jgi:hypothetical protein
MIGAELDRSVDNELVAQVNAVRDAGEEGCTRHFDSPERQTWTDTADEERGHAESNERKLPDAGRNGEIVLAPDISRKQWRRGRAARASAPHP